MWDETGENKDEDLGAKGRNSIFVCATAVDRGAVTPSGGWPAFQEAHRSYNYGTPLFRADKLMPNRLQCGDSHVTQKNTLYYSCI